MLLNKAGRGRQAQSEGRKAVCASPGRPHAAHGCRLPRVLPPGQGLVVARQERNSTLIFKLDGYVTLSKASIKTTERIKISKMLLTTITGCGTTDGPCFLFIFLDFLSIYNEHVLLVRSGKLLTSKKKKERMLEEPPFSVWVMCRAAATALGPSAPPGGSVEPAGTEQRPEEARRGSWAAHRDKARGQGPGKPAPPRGLCGNMPGAVRSLQPCVMAPREPTVLEQSGKAKLAGGLSLGRLPNPLLAIFHLHCRSWSGSGGYPLKEVLCLSKKSDMGTPI